MPVRDQTKLIHAVASPSASDYYGRTVCGRIYQRKRKGTTWKTLDRSDSPIYRMRPSSKRPTCLACVANIRVNR